MDRLEEGHKGLLERQLKDLARTGSQPPNHNKQQALADQKYQIFETEEQCLYQEMQVLTDP